VWIGNSGWNAINGVSSSESVTNNAWNHVAVSTMAPRTMWASTGRSRLWAPVPRW
jgi:hypothetical protein